MHEHCFVNMRARAGLLAALLALGGSAHAQTPDDPPPLSRDMSGLYAEMLDRVPEDDLSWVLMRSVTGEEIWDGAAEMLPDIVWKATLPERDSIGEVDPDGKISGTVNQALVPGGEIQDRSDALTIENILGGATRIIHAAGLAMLGVFGVFFIIRTTYGFATRKGGTPFGVASIRLFATFLFLSPIGNQGFCLIQGVMMAGAQIGIGGANAIWDQATQRFSQVARSDAAAVAAAENILAIAAEDQVARAFAAGICRGIVNAKAGKDLGAPGSQALIAQYSLRTAWLECGWLADDSNAHKQIAYLAERYDAQSRKNHGARLQTYLAEVLDARKELLQKAHDAGEDWATHQVAASTSVWGKGKIRFDPVGAVAYAGEPVDLLRVSTENPSADGNPAAELKTVPVVTQALWSTLEHFGSPTGSPGLAGACVANWARRLGEEVISGEDMARAIETRDANHNAGGGFRKFDRWLNNTPPPSTIWPLDSWPNRLRTPAGCELKDEWWKEAGNSSRYHDWVEELRGIGDEVTLGELMQPLYAQQMQGISGNPETGEGRRGWLMAGALYWQIQLARRLDATVREIIAPSFKDVPTESCEALSKTRAWADRTFWDKETEGLHPLACLNVRAWNIGMLTAQALPYIGTDRSPPALAYDGQAGALTVDRTEGTHKIGNSIADLLHGSLNDAAASNAPLTVLMGAGTEMMQSGLVLYGIGSVAGMLGRLKPALGKLGGLAKTLGTVLIVAGFLLGVWLPSLPMLAWLTAVWAWFVSVVLSLLAAPLWAVAHAVPDGHGSLSPYSRKGYELFLFAMLRPLLLVVGLLLAITMSALIVKVGALMYAGAITAYKWAVGLEAADNVLGSVTGWIFVAGMAIIFLVAIFLLVHKTFSLCHEVADRVFEWVGAGVRSLGDNEMLQGVERAVLAFNTRLQSGVGRVAAAAQQGGSRRR